MFKNAESEDHLAKYTKCRLQFQFAVSQCKSKLSEGGIRIINNKTLTNRKTFLH